jgi:hypothetical protein
MSRRLTVGVLLPLLGASALAVTASGEEIRAGVVTAIQGTAHVVRAAFPPRKLEFKDPVNLHDEITTGEASIARILLGGKAVLTVRERSVVRITETPGVARRSPSTRSA